MMVIYNLEPVYYQCYHGSRGAGRGGSQTGAPAVQSQETKIITRIAREKMLTYILNFLIRN